MQLVNDPPVANSQPVTVASLKLRDVVVLGIRVGGNFLNLLHNPLLPVHRKPRERFGEGFCGDDLVHPSIVTLSNTDVKLKVRGAPAVPFPFVEGAGLSAALKRCAT